MVAVRALEMVVLICLPLYWGELPGKKKKKKKKKKGKRHQGQGPKRNKINLIQVLSKVTALLAADTATSPPLRACHIPFARTYGSPMEMKPESLNRPAFSRSLLPSIISLRCVVARHKPV